MLLGTFVNEVWWPSCGKLRECTRVGYESAYRCHIQPKWADVDMESIIANDIEEWLGSFNQAGAARKAWAVLRAILRLAYRKGVTDNDVTRREIRLPHLRRYEPRVLDARQVRRLLKGFYGHALEAWLLVSVCAGLRRCESVGIEWADLDLRRGTVTVKRSVQWVAGHETVTDPKTDQSRRTVALPRFAVKRLAPRQNRQAGRRSERQPGGSSLHVMVPTHETPLRAAKEPQAHLRHSGNRCGSRYLSGRTTTRSQRHQDNRPLLSPPRFVRAEKSAAGMGKTHHRSRVAFRNPAMETSIHEQQTHSMSRRTHRHDQRQRQVRRQWTAELLDGE